VHQEPRGRLRPHHDHHACQHHSNCTRDLRRVAWTRWSGRLPRPGFGDADSGVHLRRLDAGRRSASVALRFAALRRG
jgi:hypothetical protein